MPRLMIGRGWVLLGACLLALAPALVAQATPPLGDRVSSAPPGDVSFEVPLREGVEVCERGMIRNGRGSVRFRSNGGDSGICSIGWARVVVKRAGDGDVVKVDLEPSADEPAPASAPRHLGRVEGAAAAAFLFAWVRNADGSHRGAGEALMISTVLDAVDPAPDLLGLARDRRLHRDVRKSALFWVSQVASGRVGPHLQGIAAEEAEDQEIRDAAVFALSQRPADEAVPALMQLARDAPHAQTRRRALFWLAQSDDPRVPDLFAELILRGPLGG